MSTHPVKSKTLKEWRKQLKTVLEIQRIEKELQALEKEARRRDRIEKRDKERAEREEEERIRLTAENRGLEREIAPAPPLPNDEEWDDEEWDTPWEYAGDASLDPEHPDAAVDGPRPPDTPPPPPRATHKVRRSRRVKCFCCGVKGHMQQDCWWVPGSYGRHVPQ